VKAGDPFLTSVLDEQRSRQRRDLADVPPWVKQELRPLANPASDDVAGRMETALRDLIDGLRAEWADVFDEFHRIAVLEAQWALVGDVVEASVGHDDRLVDHFETARPDRPIDDLGLFRTGDRHPVELRRLLAFYVLADELADDRYTDPALRPDAPRATARRRSVAVREASRADREASRPAWPGTDG
jgi:hypothetical protein